MCVSLSSPQSASTAVSFSLSCWCSELLCLKVKWISTTVMAHYGALPTLWMCLSWLMGMVVGSHSMSHRHRLSRSSASWPVQACLCVFLCGFKLLLNLSEISLRGRWRLLALAFEGEGGGGRRLRDRHTCSEEERQEVGG